MLLFCFSKVTIWCLREPLNNMFAATLGSRSLHKQSFLWRALEDFAVFTPCFHNVHSAVFTVAWGGGKPVIMR